MNACRRAIRGRRLVRRGARHERLAHARVRQDGRSGALLCACALTSFVFERSFGSAAAPPPLACLVDLAGLFGDEAPSFVRRLLASGSGSSAGDDAHSPPARAPACAPAREPILRPQASFDQVDHSAMPPQAPSRARGQRQPLALELCGPRIVQQELAAPAPPQEQLQTRALMRSGCFPSPTAARNDSTGTPSGLLQVSITCIASVSEIYAVPLSAHLTVRMHVL